MIRFAGVCLLLLTSCTKQPEPKDPPITYSVEKTKLLGFEDGIPEGSIVPKDLPEVLIIPRSVAVRDGFDGWWDHQGRKKFTAFFLAYGDNGAMEENHWSQDYRYLYKVYGSLRYGYEIDKFERKRSFHYEGFEDWKP